MRQSTGLFECRAMGEQEFENDSRGLALVSQLMVELSTEVVVTGER